MCEGIRESGTGVFNESLRLKQARNGLKQHYQELMRQYWLKQRLKHDKENCRNKLRITCPQLVETQQEKNKLLCI